MAKFYNDSLEQPITRDVQQYSSLQESVISQYYNALLSTHPQLQNWLSFFFCLFIGDGDFEHFFQYIQKQMSDDDDPFVVKSLNFSKTMINQIDADEPTLYIIRTQPHQLVQLINILKQHREAEKNIHNYAIIVSNSPRGHFFAQQLATREPLVHVIQLSPGLLRPTDNSNVKHMGHSATSVADLLVKTATLAAYDVQKITILVLFLRLQIQNTDEAVKVDDLLKVVKQRLNDSVIVSSTVTAAMKRFSSAETSGGRVQLIEFVDGFKFVGGQGDVENVLMQLNQLLEK